MTMGDKIILRLSKDIWNKAQSSVTPQVHDGFNGANSTSSLHSQASQFQEDAVPKAKRGRQPSISKDDSKTNSIEKKCRCGRSYVGSSNKVCNKCLTKSSESTKGAKSVQIVQPITINVANLTWMSITAHSEDIITKMKSLLTLLPANLLEKFCISNDNETEVTAVCNIKFGELIRHILALRIELIQQLFRPVLQKLMYHPRNLNIFNQPVDFVALDIPDYPVRIKCPIDLGTIRSKLQRGEYVSALTIESDLRLVFQNAMSYNPPTHGVYEIAKVMANELDSELQSRLEQCAKDVSQFYVSTPKLCNDDIISF